MTKITSQVVSPGIGPKESKRRKWKLDKVVIGLYLDKRRKEVSQPSHLLQLYLLLRLRYLNRLRTDCLVRNNGWILDITQFSRLFFLCSKWVQEVSLFGVLMLATLTKCCNFYLCNAYFSIALAMLK